MTYAPTRSTDHADRGPERFLQQFKEKAFLEAVLRSYLIQVQKLEAAVWEVVDLRALDLAEGVQLDRIGRIVGRGRNGMVDSLYRQAIRAQIRINRSEGTPVDLDQVADLSVPDGAATFAFQEGPGFVLVFMDGQAVAPVNGPLVYENLRRSKAAGVRLHLVYYLDPPETVFRYGGNLTPAELAPGSYTIARVDNGLASSQVLTDGGKLSTVIGG
jgi:hypothetical protein